MSLKVWLPLNGDINNLGTSNYTINAFRGSITYNNNGKIGKCFYANGVNTLKIINIIPDFYNYTAYSLCAWACVEAQNTSHSGSAIISAGNWNNQVLNLSMSDWSTDHYTKLRISGTSWNNTYSYNFNTNTWYHIVVCCDGVKTYAYVNGTIIGATANSFIPTSIEGNDMCIGGATYYAGMQFFGKINDVRIYDHCLSAAEVREISQGLVLHYKLDNGGHGRNLIRIGTGAYHNTNELTSVTFSGWDTYNSVSLTDMDWNNRYGQKITYSCYMENIEQTSGTGTGIMLHVRYADGTYQQFGGGENGTSGSYLAQGESGWLKLVVTIPDASTRSSPTTISHIQVSIRHNSSSGASTVKYRYPQAELGDHQTSWWWAPEDSGDLNIVQDSSGYNHNGTILNTVSISSDTPRYSCSTKLDAANSMINCGRGGMMTDSITVNMWIKSSAWANPVSCTEGGGWNFEASGDYFRFPVYVSGVGYKYGQSSTTKAQICNNEWHMLTGIYDRINQKIQIYVDGQLDNDYATGTSNNIGYHGSNCIWIGAEATGSNTTASNGMAGLFSDFRIYCTALDADAIRQLYEVGAKVDNKGNLHTFELNEQAENILFKVEKARTNLVYTDGLRSYTQANCQITLTEQGYHIYRPPNLTTANDGNTMWGGLLINNQTTRTIAPYDTSRDNVWNLQKNHTYMFAFHVKGQSSNSPALKVESNMGWDRIAGIGPNPTYLATQTVPVDFNGEQDCYTIFRIDDDIIKVATEDKSSYVQGNSYLSYRELCLNYSYTATGTLGTDLYLTDFRLYDITNHMAEFNKMGQAKFFDLIEQNGTCKIRKNSELLASEFIEL